MSTPSEALECAAVNNYLREHCKEYGASPNDKRKPYNHYTDEQRLDIAKYAEENGASAAARYFSKEYERSVNESSVRYMLKKYRQQQTEPGSGDIVSLPPAKRGRPLLLGDDLDQRVVKTITNLRQAGGVVTGPIIVGLANGIVSHHNRNLLLQNGGPISLNRTWSESIMKRMNYVKRKGTKAARKVPENFLEVKNIFFDQIRRSIQEHGIPDELILNMDETGIPVLPVSEWTMAPEGSSQVSVIGKEDKAQVTAVLTSTLSGGFPRPQLIYKGKTHQCHPKYNFPADVDVHHSENHWANRETMLRWIENCLSPYLAETKADLRLFNSQKALLILDVYAVHRTAEVKESLLQKNCIPVYVPAGCTGELQPLDVSVNSAFKLSLTNSFQAWYAEQVTEQLSVGNENPNICLRYGLMKHYNAKWIITACDHVRSKPEIVKLGWEKSGISTAARAPCPFNQDLINDRPEH